ncbi:hypothetical protein [Capnocytophaga bilenii]
MKIGEIFQVFGGLLLFTFIGTIAFDLVFTFTWPFKAGTITYIVWQNKLYLSLFMLYTSISMSYHTEDNKNEDEESSNAIIGGLSIVVLFLSIAIAAVIDIFTFTWPFKADTYTYKWWNLLWEYKLYIFIGFLVIVIIDLIIANRDTYNEEEETVQSRKTNISNSTQNIRTQRVVQTTTSQFSVEEQDFLDYLKENPSTSIDESVVSLYGISLERALELQKHIKK